MSSPHRADTPPPALRTRRLRIGLLTAGAMLVGSLLPLGLHGSAQAATAPNGGDVIANLFQWNWKSVANECTTVPGPKGYGAVQVAPPQDSIKLSGAHPWWEVFQPVSYKLNSRMGTEAQFKDMVAACHSAGVKVYADAVINHMAGSNQTSTNSYGDASFNPANYTYNDVPYSRSDFHFSPPCPNSNLGINDWNNVTQVQECQLLSLSDLYTESDYVRGKIAGYLNTMIDVGVDGFRVDAAKHIAQADMANIISRLHNTTWNARPYVYQEVFPGSSGQLAPSAFESNGSVLEFTYAYKLKDQFNGNIANLKTFGQSWGLEPSDKSAVMVTNHDLERDKTTITYTDGAKYTLAHIFELAWNYGTPQVYAGFAFANRDDSPPADAGGYVTDTNCSTSWVCTDRNQGIANMVGWHNATKGQQVANWWDNGNNAIAFSRGDKGWVALNNSSSDVTQTFTTGLAPGTYCDVIHGDATGTACTGPTVTVDSAGKATATVKAHDALALYALGTPCTTDCPTNPPTTPPTNATVSETFNETRQTVWGENVFLAGSLPQLGNWAPADAIPLSSAGYPTWSAAVDLPANTAFEYKYIVKDSAGKVTWESGANHTASTGSSNGTLNDTWNGSGSTKQVSVNFSENKTTVLGQNVYVVGSIPQLGNWAPGSAVALSSANYPNWTGTVAIPGNTAFEYKYIVKDSAGNVTWESGTNRTYTTGASGSVNLNDTWK
ncbi:carbohydrate-binding module family 20 domain-containing protein [Streptomyces sp. GbtcB7]|uniref:carbohydrate-binding module family 20 domain-containing protein n=1 Tax=Streptomyces sp. GbtcB7 TaxID=2824752 RepID=UPI001C3096B6|nr:carbohydrate-binding module family 20 domain-containing protein [Streptomyces sp. GbtcB7]